MEFFGAVAAIRNVPQVIRTRTSNQILIFSLLNIRKKTSAIIAGIMIGAGSLWGLSMWQNISREEMFTILGAVLMMLLGIVVTALILTAVFKTISMVLGKILSRESENDQD